MQQTDTSFVFRHKLPVQWRFNDVDRFGHINNNVYFSLYDMAKTEYLGAVAGGLITEDDIHPVVAHVEADFLLPVHYGDSIEIHTAVTHLGRTSFVISQEAMDMHSGTVACRCTTVMVCFSSGENLPVPLPPSWRARIKAYEPEGDRL